MPSNNELLAQLKPFKNEELLIVDDHNVGDIISAILQTHKEYAEQYDHIYMYFVGSTPTETAENVFKYLKANVKYNIEPENTQTVKSPAAIIATGRSGSDCKNYALFINGVLDAYRRNELEDFNLIYRFASYEPGDQTPQHVFSVMVINGNEVWIDPVLSYFNQKKQPSSYKDKKVKNMALVGLSGINDVYENYYQHKNMGDPYGNYYNSKKIGALVPSNTPGIALIDDITGIYKDVDGTWYLNNGTPLLTYDPNTGAYQEQNGNWYTYQGLELLSYNINTGDYQEKSGLWYNKEGVQIPATTTTATPVKASLNNNTLLIGGGALFLIILLTSKKR